MSCFFSPLIKHEGGDENVGSGRCHVVVFRRLGLGRQETVQGIVHPQENAPALKTFASSRPVGLSCCGAFGQATTQP